MSKMSKLRDVSINPTSVENLNLSKSEDLICKNLMCEKLGEVCICKLARWASINAPSLDNIQALELENNGLTVLPDSVFDLNQIEYLNLSHNLLTEFPIGIIRLQNLKILDLSHNKLIGNLPTYIQTMTYDDDDDNDDGTVLLEHANDSILPKFEHRFCQTCRLARRGLNTPERLKYEMVQRFPKRLTKNEFQDLTLY